MPSAEVYALERLVEFKAALQIFADKGKDAMSGNQMEIRRSLDWVEGQLASWKAEIRHAEDAVIQAEQRLVYVDQVLRLMEIGPFPLSAGDRPGNRTGIPGREAGLANLVSG